MHQYVTGWAIATFVVSPTVLFLVPVAHRLVDSLPGPHSSDSVWADFLGMVGYYGGYVLLAATAGSLLYTWVIRRLQPPSRMMKLSLGAAVGALVLLPQGVAFGVGYVVINVAIGAAAGAMFAMLMALPPFRAKSTARGGEQTG